MSVARGNGRAQPVVIRDKQKGGVCQVVAQELKLRERTTGEMSRIEALYSVKTPHNYGFQQSRK